MVIPEWLRPVVYTDRYGRRWVRYEGETTTQPVKTLAQVLDEDRGRFYDTNDTVFSDGA